MMFEGEITVETTHIVGAEALLDIAISKGVITWVSVLFPAGCHNQTHITVSYNDFQIFPSASSQSIVGDGTPIEWADYVECYQPAYVLKVKGWGVGNTYDHKVVVRVAVMPRKGVMALAIADAIISIFTLLSPKNLKRRVIKGVR